MTTTSVNRGWLHWTLLGASILSYLSAHVYDYVVTTNGLARGIREEWNPLFRDCFKLFGLKLGLIGYKAVVSLLLVMGAVTPNLAYKKKGKGWIVIAVFFLGSLLTIGTSSLWLLY